MMKVVSKHGVPIQFPTAWSQFPGGLFYGDPLWVDEVAMRHPNVPIILTKMGRSIGRYFDSAMTVAMRNVNIYFDVVGTNPQHLRFAIDKIGAHRIMFGTDWSATWRWISVPTTLHKLRLKVLDDAKLTRRGAPHDPVGQCGQDLQARARKPTGQGRCFQSAAE